MPPVSRRRSQQSGLTTRLSGNHIRRLVLQQSRRAGVGHIGSALSIADIVAVMYGDVLRGVGAHGPERDVFYLSKGHAALAVYAALNALGQISDHDLATYCGNDSLLGVHPEHELAGIELSTGSLGHALSIAAGNALGARIGKINSRVFALLSDAELNEGSVWEAVMFAAQMRLDNLVAIVDVNGQQALAPTREVLDLEPLGERWRAFGWHVIEIDGHDVKALRTALAAREGGQGQPAVVLARTTSGRGVSFMEGRVEWHYLPMTEEQYQQALAEVASAPQ